MAEIKQYSEKYSALKMYIEKGTLKIPQFQRDFVWDLQKSADLIDSIIKGFPIGSIIFWSTDEGLRAIKEIGGIKLAERPKGEVIKYILDGQQRVTSAYAVLEGITIESKNNKEVDYSNVFIDLEADANGAIVVIDPTDESDNGNRYIKVCDLYEPDLQELANYPSEYHTKLKKYGDILKQFQFPVIELMNADINAATEVFTRLNTGGQPLTLFDIMVARTYDEEKDFDLAKKYSQVIEKLGEKDYDTISDMTILQVVSVLLTSSEKHKNILCTRKQILALDKDDFIDIWEASIEAIYDAVNYFKNYYKVPVSKLLPYNALIVPYAYYFHKEGNVPSGEVEKKLTDLFWRISLGNRYSSSVEAKIVQDIQKVNTILRGDIPKYDWTIMIEKEDIINNGWFSVGRSYIKALLSIMAAKGPLSFKGNVGVNISNDYLKAAHSRNYHHFFPKAFMKKKLQGEEDWRVNTIANITIVDDFLNKREIKARAPSDYMQSFSKDNNEISETMKTHLIDDLQGWGVLEDNFVLFLHKRAEAISKEIHKRIIPQATSSIESELIQYAEVDDAEE